MYISNLTHFLDEKGNIPKEMPAEARKMAGFLAMVVDLTTQRQPTVLTTTTLRCFNQGCKGLINTTFKAGRRSTGFAPNVKMKG